MIFQTAGIQTGIGEGVKSIVEIILQASGGLLSGIVEGYMSYTQQVQTTNKLLALGTFALLASVMTLWEKDSIAKQKSSVIISLFAAITRLFAFLSIFAVLIPGTSIARTLYYAAFIASIIGNFGVQGALFGWFKPKGMMQEKYGMERTDDVSYNTAKKIVKGGFKGAKTATRYGSEKIGEIIKKNKEKTTQARIDILKVAIESAKLAEKKLKAGQSFCAGKRSAFSSENYEKAEEIRQNQNSIFLFVNDIVKVIAVAELTDEKTQKKFINGLPHDSALSKEINKEIFEDRKIQILIKEFTSDLSSLSKYVKENNFNKEERVWIKLRNNIKNQKELLEKVLKGYEQILKSTGISGNL